MGEVPNAALIENATPKAIIVRPIAKIKYLLNNSDDFFPIFIDLCFP